MAFCKFSTWDEPAAHHPANPKEANVAHTAIPVTLTSVKNPADKRYLVIYHGSSTLIGRASKSESKNLQPSPTNALFDCPVISREHAELKTNKFASAGEQITITDRGSMHGTHVNGRKLDRFVPFTLRSGDLLQFGTRVTRGPGMFELLNTSLDNNAKLVLLDTHDGVYVTFEGNVAKPTSSKFVVPDGSEDELSDEEENSSVSHISDDEEVEEVSSAKTTPEQVKSQPGSAQQPIDLTSMPPPPPPRHTFINLVDDARDGGYYSGTYRPQSPVYPPRRNFASMKYSLVDDDDDYEPSPTLYPTLNKTSSTKTADLIQDSVDKDADVLVPESVPLNHLETASIDEDSVLDHNTGLTGLLNKPNDAASAVDIDEGESEPEDNLEVPVEDEEDEDDSNEEAERMSDSEASDLYGDFLDEDFEDYNSYSAKKHVSPELTSALPAKAAPSTQVPFKIGSQWTSGIPVKPATQPYYDPVRASHVGAPTAANSTHTLPAKVASAPSTQAYRPYMYAPPTHVLGHYNAYPTTNMSNSSRWDVPPSTSYNPPIAPYGPAGPSTRSFNSGYGYLPAYPDPEPQPYDFQKAFKDFEQDFEANLRKPLGGIEKQVAVEAAAMKKNSMKISDMVEKAADAMIDVVNGAEETIVAGGKKRKADEMEKNDPFPLIGDVVEPAVAAEEDAAVEINRDTAIVEVQQPPAQRRKIEQSAATNTTARNVAGGIAKYATAAAVGGAGTIAFLCSPLMERLLEYMA